MGFFYLDFLVYPLGFAGTGFIFYAVFLASRRVMNEESGIFLLAGITCVIASNVLQLTYDLVMKDYSDAVAATCWIMIFIAVCKWTVPPGTKKKARKLIGGKAKAARDKIARKLKDAKGRLPDLRGRLRPQPLPV